MWKKWLPIILLILPILFLFCTKKEEGKNSTFPETARWPVFRGDPRLSGIAKESLPDKLALVWSFETGSAVISSPVVGFGRVYIGSTDGTLYCLNAGDGSQVWTFDAGDDIEASPLLLDQTIYIGSLSGDFFAIDAISGKERWKVEIGSEIYGSANWAEEDSQEKVILVGSYDAKLYCLHAETGELKWTYETDNYINGAAATDGQHTVCGGCDAILHIVSVSDGKRIGGVETGSYIPGSAALVDNRAYVGHYGSKLLCIDIIEEKIVWEYENKQDGGPFFSSPAIGQERIVVGSRDGFVHCIDRKTGNKIWTFRTRDEVDSSPVISGPL